MSPQDRKEHIPLQEIDLEEHKTKDGSCTIRRKDSGWMYRSIHGAEQESCSVFVEGAMLSQKKEEWKVFELGFGMGTNFAMTVKRAEELGVVLYYEAVDHLPVPPSFARHPLAQKALQEARSKRATARVSMENLTLVLHPFSFASVEPTEKFDAIFHDPFGPTENPDCWTDACFTLQSILLKEDGVWTSYGAAGRIRRALARAGLYVAIGTGVGKKRETTRAAKKESVLKGLKIKYRPQ
jgi:tRNA U34 5-methylaminomethyl-2-thiouridine-forming methyltransferase MnmC